MADDPIMSFKTHAAYLEAICMSLEVTYAPGRFEGGVTTGFRDPRRILEGVASGIRNSEAYERLRRLEIDREPLASSLFNAWTTEALLNLTGAVVPAEGIGAATNWSVVQAYYAVFQITRGLSIASGERQPLTTHAQVRRFAESYWCAANRRVLPWSFGYGPSGPVNTPDGATIASSIRAWDSSTPSNCWTFIAQALRTTRADALQERYDDERERKNKDRATAAKEKDRLRAERGLTPLNARHPKASLSTSEKDKINRGLRAFTIIDFLYRLRIRSNYRDITMWTEGAPYPERSQTVHRSLELISAATLLAHELFIRRRIGSAVFDEIATEWLDRIGAPMPGTVGLELRSGLLFT